MLGAKNGENMATWLYNSSGYPIAFIDQDNVFSKTGRFIGRLDGNEVWHGSYKGEIVLDDRFLYDVAKSSLTRSMSGIPGSPGIPGIPGSKGATGLPSNFQDV